MRSPGARDDAHVDVFPRLSAIPAMRIGHFDDPDIGFSRVSGIDIDRDGNIYVLEASLPEIRVFGPEGELLRRIGGRGGGPGEFEDSPRFGVLGDTVWAVEQWANRITLFDRDGAVLSTGRFEPVAVPLPAGFGYVLPQMMRSDGLFASHLSMVGGLADAPPSGVQPTDSIPVPFVLFDASGAVTDTIGWADRPPPRMWRPPWEDDSRQRQEYVEIEGQRMAVPTPPTTLPSWEPFSDGYLLVETPQPETADDASFTVTRIGLNRDTVYRHVFRYRPTAYSPTELDSIAARAARGEAGGMVPYSPMGDAPPPNWPAIARSLRARMSFPEFQLPLQYPWIANDESVWLRRASVDRVDVDWIVLDPEGRPRGRLELPSGARPRWSDGDTFWATVPDEYEVPWVVRFRIEADDERRAGSDHG